MLNWLHRRARPSIGTGQASAPVEHPPRPAATGRYALLYKYLNDRYADTVVLTFAEIEDLIGFRLPDQARDQLEWWTGTVRSTHSDAWTLASRTASPNLLACTVAFDRG
jgi:hypothetical protein